LRLSNYISMKSKIDDDDDDDGDAVHDVKQSISVLSSTIGLLAEEKYTQQTYVGWG